MKRFLHIAVLLIVGMLCLPAVPHADQAQYFYDELGRLVGVVEGSGNAAVYSYDAVGNLLSVQRFTTGTSGIAIFLVAPNSALVGANVEIKGFGFDPTQANNQVKFNGTTATVVSATATSIVATVPSGATTGSVTVTNTNGTATSPQAFTVLVPPIISAIEPAKAAQGTITRVVIEGFNLNTATAVTFTQSGISATILSGVTAQSLPINLTVTPAVPVGSYTFSVVSPLGTVQSGTVTVTVTLPMPSFSVAPPTSVFRPFPAQTPPSGPSFSVAPPLSVQMP
jgi:YD repeat-containing protein